MFNSRISIAALAVTMFVTAPVSAAKGVGETTHDGKFVSISGDRLTMTNKDGKEYSPEYSSQPRDSMPHSLASVLRESVTWGVAALEALRFLAGQAHDISGTFLKCKNTRQLLGFERGATGD